MKASARWWDTLSSTPSGSTDISTFMAGRKRSTQIRPKPPSESSGSSQEAPNLVLAPRRRSFQKAVYRPRRVRARLPSPSPGFRYRTRVHRLFVDAGTTGDTIGLLHPSCALRVSDNSAEETANLFSSRSIARKFLTLALSVG